MNISSIGIVSQNITASLKFYKNLGLDFKASSDDHYECQMTNGLRIMIDSIQLVKKINPDFVMPKSSHISLGFEQESKEQVDVLVNKIKKLGHTIIKEPWDAFWGQRYAIISDPDGTQIDIFANLQKEV